MKTLLKILVVWWNDIGYMLYDELAQDKSELKATKNDKENLVALIKIILDNLWLKNKTEVNNKGLIVNYEQPYITEEIEFSDLMEVFSNHIHKKFVDDVFNYFKEVSELNDIFIKFTNIEYYTDIEPNRWMSFSRNMFDIQTQFGKNVIIVRGPIEFVNTKIDGFNYGDPDEVLINSSDLINSNYTIINNLTDDLISVDNKLKINKICKL